MMGRLEEVEAELAGLEAGLDLPVKTQPARELREHLEFVEAPRAPEANTLGESVLKGIDDLNNLIEAATAVKSTLLDIAEQLRKRN
jgi:hypothetical protein